MKTIRWSYLLRVAALALLYALLAKYVLELLSPNGVTSIVWPLSGLALAVLLLGGKKYWPGIFIGALFGNMLAGSSFPASIFFASGDTLEVLAAAWLLSRNGHAGFLLANLNNYIHLLWVAAVSASIGALAGCSTLWATGILTQQSAGPSLLQWWQGDVLGMIVLTPLILMWKQAPRNWLRNERFIETIACFGLAFLAGQIVFLGWLSEFFGIYARGFWMFIFIVWSAVRFGRHGASLTIAMFALQAILSPLLKVGFFAQDIANTGLTNYWVYTLVLSIVGMSLATLNFERSQNEKAIRERETRLKAIIDNAMDAVVLMDSTGRISDWSKQAEQVFGWPREDAIGRAMHETIIPARYRNACHQGLQHLLASGKSKIMNNRIETHALHRDGHEFPIELTVSQIVIDGKQEFNAFIRDITQSRLATEKLRKLSMVVEETGNSVIITDPQGIIEYVNPAFSRISGYTAKEVLGRNSNILSSGWTPAETYQSLWAHLHSGKEWRGELHNLKKNGETLWESQTISILRDEQGEISHFVAIKEDITARKQAEEHLQRIHDELVLAYRKLSDAQAYLLQAEKMTSIGQLAAGVAHEINNPVGFIYSNMLSLENYFRDLLGALDVYQQTTASVTDPEMAATMQRMQQELDLDFLRQDIPILMNESREGITRVKNIVQSLREFAQIDTTANWYWESLHRCLDNTLNVLQGALPPGVKIIRKYAELPEIECLPAQLNQMFMNILLNAAQATEGQGCITLISGCDENQVWVEISDTGVGIAPENISRIFEPFFSTRPAGLGTGLGLVAVFNTVTHHHGKIEVRSKPGEGTAFHISLPIRQQASV